MSDPESLINFKCACGKPVAAPASLAGQHLHCPYEGCEQIIQAPAAETSPDAPAEAAPAAESGTAAKGKQPRMPPPKGLKSGKGLAAARKPRPPAAAGTEAGGEKSPAVAQESGPVPAAPSAEGKKKKNKLFFAACSGITLIIALVLFNRPQKPAANPAGKTTVSAPAAAPRPATPSRGDPAPPLQGGARAPRQAVDAESLSARLAQRVAEQKQSAAADFSSLLAAAREGNSEEWIALAEAYLNGDGTEVNPAEARKWLERAAKRRVSRAYYLLGDMSVKEGDLPAAVRSFVQGAASISSAKSPTRDGKLEAFAERLDQLGATHEAAAVRARIADPSAPPEANLPQAEPVPAVPDPDPVPDIPAPEPAPPAPAEPAPPEPEVPGIPEI
jgi:TPR repeat protein